MSIKKLCQLPEIALCKLQAKSICQVVDTLSHDGMWLSGDGQLVLVSGSSSA
jgi:hypothetical protein